MVIHSTSARNWREVKKAEWRNIVRCKELWMCHNRYWMPQQEMGRRSFFFFFCGIFFHSQLSRVSNNKILKNNYMRNLQLILIIIWIILYGKSWLIISKKSSNALSTRMMTKMENKSFADHHHFRCKMEEEKRDKNWNFVHSLAHTMWSWWCREIM